MGMLFVATTREGPKPAKTFNDDAPGYLSSDSPWPYR